MAAHPLGLGILLLTGAMVMPVTSAAPVGAVAVPVPSVVVKEVPHLEWGPCTDLNPQLDDEALQCAMARVPLDHDDPHGPTIRIALAKYPASRPERKIGTLFVNPGGPGGSGVGMAYFAGSLLDEGLKGRFDIIGFDPRGMAFSASMRCFASQKEQDAFASQVRQFPDRNVIMRPFFRVATTLYDVCAARERRVLEHMSTRDVALDLDLLRQAVGDRRLTYMGLSYGTFLGQVYANMFPDKVRAMVFDGVLDPVQYTNGQQIDANEYATQKVMDEFLRLCDAAAATDPTVCPLARGKGGAAARWAQLLRRVKKESIEADLGTVTYADIVTAAGESLYDSLYWPDMGIALSELLRISTGAVRAEGLSPQTRDFLTAYKSYDSGSFEGFFGNHCADIEYPTSYGDWKRRGLDAAVASPFGAWWWWGFAPCATWPVDEDRYTGPWTPDTDRPFLIVGSEFDPATPIEAARSVSRLIANDRLVTYKGYGHVAWTVDACATDLIHDYLRTATLPARTKSTCPAPNNPFLPVSIQPNGRSILDEILVGGRPPRFAVSR